MPENTTLHFKVSKISLSSQTSSHLPSAGAINPGGILAANRVIQKLRHAIHVVRSVGAYLFLAAFTLIIGPPVLFLARLTNRPSWLLAVGLAGIRAQLALAGVRTRVIGQERLPRHKAAVVLRQSQQLPRRGGVCRVVSAMP